MANRIILKRNVGVTGPTGGQLVPGEPAIAMDGPTGANSKLYVGIADTVTGSVDNVVAVGGGYYTKFVDDIYSKKSIIEGTEQSFTTALRSKITGNEAAIAAITGSYVTGGNVSQFANDAGYLSTHDHNTVDSFNGSTGAVIGVNSIAVLTGSPNASTVRTAIDVDEIYTKKSIIVGTEQSFTTALSNKITTNETNTTVNTAAISAITGTGVSQFSNDSAYITGFTLSATAQGGGSVTHSGIEDDLDGNPGSTPRINEFTVGAGGGISLTLSRITGASSTGQPDINAGAKLEITNSLTTTALLKTGGVLQVSQNSILHTGQPLQLVSANLDISTAAFIEFTSTGKVTGNLPVDGDGVFGGGVSATGLITGSNIPSTGDIVTGGGAPTFSGMNVNGDFALTGGDFTIGGGHALIIDEAGNFLKQNGVDVGYLSQANGLLRFNIFSMQTARELCHLNDEDTFIRFPEANHVQLAAGGQIYHSMIGGKNHFPVELAVTGGVDATGRITGSNIPSGTILSSTLGSAVDGNDQTVSKVALKDYGETIHYVGTSSNPTFNFENGNVQHCTGSSGIGGGNAITLSNPPPNGVAGTMTIICINCGVIPNAGAFWPSTIKWPGGIEPNLTNSGTDIFSVMTHDGGASYYGFMGGMQFA